MGAPSSSSSWRGVRAYRPATTTCGPPGEADRTSSCASVPSDGDGLRLRRQGRQLGLVCGVHLRLHAVLGQGLAERLAHERRLVGVVDLVATDALADPRLRHALGVANGHDLVLER